MSSQGKKVKMKLKVEMASIKDCGKTMLHVGLFVKGESIKRTPRDEGNLRNSHYVQQNGNTVEIGATANYAVKIHEDLNIKLQASNMIYPVGQKYLERAISENEDKIVKLIAKGI